MIGAQVRLPEQDKALRVARIEPRRLAQIRNGFDELALRKGGFAKHAEGQGIVRGIPARRAEVRQTLSRRVSPQA